MHRARIAQYGTRHGHAAGKLAALRASPAVELAGVYEPDHARRHELRAAGGVWEGVRWYERADELLGDPATVAVAAEGGNHEALAHAEEIVRAGKHLWYDKPAGADLGRWRDLLALAEARGLVVQMGYMFRYHHGFGLIAGWARQGLLGEIFAVRAHMSTWLPEPERRVIAAHPGGICYDLAGHMLDQVVWLLGRPLEVRAFLRHDDDQAPGFADNTLAVLSFPRALAYVDIAAMEAPPPARRFEVYGRRGTATMEPFEPAAAVRLCLAEPAGGFARGEQLVPVAPQPRQELYDLELAAFLEVLAGRRPPERPYAHDLLVQETLLRCAEPRHD